MMFITMLYIYVILGKRSSCEAVAKQKLLEDVTKRAKGRLRGCAEALRGCSGSKEWLQPAPTRLGAHLPLERLENLIELNKSQ